MLIALIILLSLEIFYTAQQADEKQRYIVHAEAAALRIILALTVVAFVSDNATELLIKMGIYLSLYWVLFDLGLNLFRGKPWNYLPEGSPSHEARLDRIWGQNWKAQYVVKFFTLILFLWLFFYFSPQWLSPQGS